VAASAGADAASIISCPSCGARNRVRPSTEGVPRCSVCHTLMPWSVEARPDTFEAELRASVPVLIDFWAPWCGPCKWIEPALEELAKEKAGKLKIVRLNVDAAPEISSRYEVRGIPALVMTRDGLEVDRLAGAVPKPQLESWVERHLGAAAAT
jgi:thioredoxin 2